MSTAGLTDFFVLQGNIRLAFLKIGAGANVSHDLAAEALYIFATSSLIKDEYKKAYNELSARDIDETEGILSEPELPVQTPAQQPEVAFELTMPDTSGTKGWPKRPCLWLRDGAALYPLFYIQKAKWLTDGQFTAVLDGLSLIMSKEVVSQLILDEPGDER